MLRCKESDTGLRTEDTPWWDWQTSLEQTCEGRPLPPCISYLCCASGTERLDIRRIIITHSLHAPLHEKSLLGGKRQYVLRIDDPRTRGLQTNGDAIMPPHDNLTLTIQGNSARTTSDFDPLPHGERRVT